MSLDVSVTPPKLARSSKDVLEAGALSLGALSPSDLSKSDLAKARPSDDVTDESALEAGISSVVGEGVPFPRATLGVSSEEDVRCSSAEFDSSKASSIEAPLGMDGAISKAQLESALLGQEVLDEALLTAEELAALELVKAATPSAILASLVIGASTDDVGTAEALKKRADTESHVRQVRQPVSPVKAKMIQERMLLLRKIRLMVVSRKKQDSRSVADKASQCSFEAGNGSGVPAKKYPHLSRLVSSRFT